MEERKVDVAIIGSGPSGLAAAYYLALSGVQATIYEAKDVPGGMLALAYSNMRGYGSVHPVIGELRVGYLPVPYKNPVSGVVETIGEILVTEAEVISRIADDGGPAVFSLRYGLCFGHNETKDIAMAVLDRDPWIEQSEVKAHLGVVMQSDALDEELNVDDKGNGFPFQDIAQVLFPGCDVWLNNPRRPNEASGTSGMKAAINGVLNLSVLDGWWIEGHIEGVTGWAIDPPPDGADDPRASEAAGL